MSCTRSLLLSLVALTAAIWTVPGQGFCIGEVQHVFIPAETYPRALKEMHLRTPLVEDGRAAAVMVVDLADPLYTALAADVNAAIRALPGLSEVSLPVIDDDAFLQHPRFDSPLLLIGNYATNRAVRRYVYEKELQLVDIGRPGPYHWVVSNLRIGQELDGAYRATNAIVVASESPLKLREAVDFVRNTMLPAAHQADSIIFDESTADRRSTHWSVAPDYTPPDSTPPDLTNAHGLGAALTHANLYALTGSKKEADLFVNIMNNYGAMAEDPRWFGPHPPGQGFNDQVGDNSGALDFNVMGLLPAWEKVQRSPYFSDPNLPRHPGTELDERLYIDKLINWMMREYYKCSVVRGLPEEESADPPVRGAIGFAARDGFPLGNHELRAALGLFLAGQYFTRDGYAYNGTNVQDYFYDARYPDDHAAAWVRDGDIAFAPYLELSWSNDDGGGYYPADTSFTRQYLRFKDSPALSDAYYATVGGSLGIGMDRSVADTFCLITPNSLMKPGFGDTHEIGGPEYEVYDLRFWREQYLDGRYGWMADELYQIGFLQPSKWGKPLLQYGLVDLRALGIRDQEPVDLLGLRVIPLQRNLFNIVNNFGGRSSYGNFNYGDPLLEAQVAPAEAVNKVILRSGWGHGFDGGRDQYVGLDGVSYLGHGHEDALGIFGFEDNGCIFLVDNTYYSAEREFQNAVTVRKTDEPVARRRAASNSSTTVRADHAADFVESAFLDLELPEYGNFVAWSIHPTADEWSVDLHRCLFWRKEGLLVVLDQARANNAGRYALDLRWKPNYTWAYSAHADGDTVRIDQTKGSNHCAVRTLDASYAKDESHGNMLTTSFHSLEKGQTGNIVTLIWAFQGSDDPDYRISAAGVGPVYRVTSPVTHEEMYFGKAEGTAAQTVGGFEVRADMFSIATDLTAVPVYFALVNGRRLTGSDRSLQLFVSDRPASVECRTAGAQAAGGTIITGPGTTVISALYLPAGGRLMVDGRPAALPLSLDEGAHQFSYGAGS